jgi:hypothetical protein
MEQKLCGKKPSSSMIGGGRFPQKINSIKESQMSERNPEQKQNTVSLTHEQLQDLMRVMLQEANKPNWLEQKQLDAEIEKDRRRSVLAIELGRVEEEAKWRRQHSCTHTRDEKSGNAAPRGKGVFTTSGQIHSDDVITLICMRCATTWRWKASPEEREYVNNAGLLHFAPPPVEHCLNKSDFVERPKPRLETIAQ